MERLDFDNPKPVTTSIVTRAEHLTKFGGGRISREEVRKRTGDAMRRNLPTHRHCINQAEEWAIIGGGPSINDCVDDIRALKRRGVNIVSVNKSHDWLLEKGIVPWGHVLLDPKEWVADYVKRPRIDVRYFVASQCHEATFKALDGYPVFLWHAGQEFGTISEPGDYLRANWPNTPWFVIPGPTTVGLRAVHLGADMGARRFHMFGMDSSRAAGRMHGYAKDEAKDAQSGRLSVNLRGRRYVFDTNSHMARQWADLDKFVKQLPDWLKKLPPGFSMTFYGSGLIPFYAAGLKWHAKPECNEDPAKVGGYIEAAAVPNLTALLGDPFKTFTLNPEDPVNGRTTNGLHAGFGSEDMRAAG